MTLNELINKLKEIHEHNKADGVKNTAARELEMLLPELERELNARKSLSYNSIVDSAIDRIIENVSVIEELDKLFEEYRNSGTEEERERKLKRIMVISHTVFILAGLKVPKSY